MPLHRTPLPRILVAVGLGLATYLVARSAIPDTRAARSSR